MQNALRTEGASTRRTGWGAIGTPGSLAVVATVAVAAAGWIVTIQRMGGMDMGVATRLGSLSSFISVWVPMMAAMMLPGTAPLAGRIVGAGGRMVELSRYLLGYLAVWAALGVGVYAVYRPHSTAVAGALTLAAGGYELTPVKRRYRQAGREQLSSGWRMGLCCAVSSAGLMLVMLALGVMSVTWMAAVAAVVLLQKLSRPRKVVDVGVAMAIVALGIAVLIAPSSVPGLSSPMPM
jgi:predicted metal-binding membrane protein